MKHSHIFFNIKICWVCHKDSKHTKIQQKKKIESKYEAHLNVKILSRPVRLFNREIKLKDSFETEKVRPRKIQQNPKLFSIFKFLHDPKTTSSRPIRTLFILWVVIAPQAKISHPGLLNSLRQTIFILRQFLTKRTDFLTPLGGVIFSAMFF